MTARAGRMLRISLSVLMFQVLLASVGSAAEKSTVRVQSVDHGRISLNLRAVDITEVMEMLSRKQRLNILLADGVEGTVSLNLYDVEVKEAIKLIAAAAGYAVEDRNGTYFVVKHDEMGKYTPGGVTELRTFKVQYSDPALIAEIVKNHISGYGQITTLPERRLLVVEDTPLFLNRVERLLKAIDRQPRQILIEAKILEIGLRDGESFGLDWAKIFSYDGGEGSFGVRGLSNPGSPGVFFDLVTPNIEVFLDSLRSRARLRTLSTPKLLALEDREAEAIVGDRQGYNVTTTIDTVTTTSVEFLESGVILKVRPSVDGQGRILLQVHPEVSTGTVSDDGIPSQTTTEVTTTMLVESGKTVFIGGLIKQTTQESREGVPILGDIPLIGLAFSNRAITSINSELVVLITPYIVDREIVELDNGKSEYVNQKDADLDSRARKINKHFKGMSYIGEGWAEESSDRQGHPASETE
jgi:type II secretory pathway component GspD/PulD (secretin)